jgi:hypothetical protein
MTLPRKNAWKTYLPSSEIKMKQARATFAWHQGRDTNSNLHQTQTTVETKFRNVLLLWVYQ